MLELHQMRTSLGKAWQELSHTLMACCLFFC